MNEVVLLILTTIGVIGCVVGFTWLIGGLVYRGFKGDWASNHNERWTAGILTDLVLIIIWLAFLVAKWLVG